MDVTIIPRTGLRLKNPVIAASGTFGYGNEFADRMDIVDPDATHAAED